MKSAQSIRRSIWRRVVRSSSWSESGFIPRYFRASMGKRAKPSVALRVSEAMAAICSSW